MKLHEGYEAIDYFLDFQILRKNNINIIIHISDEGYNVFFICTKNIEIRVPYY